MQELRKRRAGDELVEEEVEETEVVIPLEEQIENFWDVRAPLEGLAVSIRSPIIEMPLLKRLGEPIFVTENGLQNMLSTAYLAISRKAIQAAFKEADNETIS